MQKDPSPHTAAYTQNVPRRLSRQCVSVPGDSVLDNMQASGNSCPAEHPDEPSSLCERPRCCDRSRNSVSVQSMPNNMQAGGNTCPAGPLDDADSLPNVPRRCGRQRIPDSFFLSSPNVPRRCGRQRNPDSFFFSSSNLPRCCDRQRISPPSSSSCDSDCSDPVSFNHASNSSHSSHDVRRGMQIFSPCPPRSAVQVSLSPAGRFFRPYRQGEAQVHVHGSNDDDSDAASCTS